MLESRNLHKRSKPCLYYRSLDDSQAVQESRYATEYGS